MLRMQIAMMCMILGIIFFGILLGSIAEALQAGPLSWLLIGRPDS